MEVHLRRGLAKIWLLPLLTTLAFLGSLTCFEQQLFRRCRPGAARQGTNDRQVVPVHQFLWVERGRSSWPTVPEAGLPELGKIRIYDRSGLMRRNRELRVRTETWTVTKLGDGAAIGFSDPNRPGSWRAERAR